MQVLTLTIRLHASWVQSLKEKRMIVKSILGKVQNKFNVSVAEVDKQDVHKIIVIGIAGIVAHQAQADAMGDAIIDFIEMNTEAEILDVDEEICRG